MAKKLFEGGMVVIRRFGTYVNTVLNNEESVRKFLFDNCPPNWDYSDEDARAPKVIPARTSTENLLLIAKEKGFTLDLA